MAKHTVEFITDARFVRRRREQKTIDAMLRMYCRGHGHARAEGAPLCGECGVLRDYAARRLERCVFGDAKPACSNCLVHCYRDDMCARVRDVMRWSGPRMLLRHPVLAILHLIDESRPAPRLPERKRRESTAAPAQHCPPEQG